MHMQEFNSKPPPRVYACAYSHSNLPVYVFVVGVNQRPFYQLETPC